MNQNLFSRGALWGQKHAKLMMFYVPAFFLFFFFSVLGMEPRASYVLGKCSIT
jgi:hypothetical protein